MAFKKILVPLDGSENSEKTLRFATGMATALNAEIVLLAVVEKSPALNDRGEGDPEEKGKLERGGSEATHYLEMQAGDIRKVSGSIKVSEVVATGDVADAILEQAKETGADMIAMSTHRDSAIERGILGSVTDTVLRSSPVPVLAIRPDGSFSLGPNAAPTSVIVPIDGSELSETAVPVALDIAEACSAEVVFMRSVHLPTFAVAGPGMEYYNMDIGITAERQKAEEYLAPFVGQAEERGLKARAHVMAGSAAARVIEETRDQAGAMVVISSHGRGGFKRMLLGSVADKIVRASHHPTLVLKPEK